jgi:hypothetical protein
VDVPRSDGGWRCSNVQSQRYAVRRHSSHP